MAQESWQQENTGLKKKIFLGVTWPERRGGGPFNLYNIQAVTGR